MTRWFLEPRSAKANRIFAGFCSDMKEANAHECEDKKPHNLWEARWESIQALKNSAWMNLTLGTDFRIWKQETPNGKIRSASTGKKFFLLRS